MKAQYGPTYDVLIIGAGVSGAALLYMLSKYTNAKVGVIEKYHEPALVNTDPTQNSQTLHCGDIETNYTLEKAVSVRDASNILKRYATAQHNADKIIHKMPKMVIGVGTEEAYKLQKRFEQFSPYYPNLRLLDRHQINEIEPNVIKGRNDAILAMGSTDDYAAVNFEALTHSFINNAVREPFPFVYEKDHDLMYNEQVEKITRNDNDEFMVKTDKNRYWARSVVVCAGGHSLKIAHQMGYGLNLSVLPVAGSYYFTPQVLNGKVYTVQNDKLPFAAIHGDPDVVVPGTTRFGPTAAILPLLERYNLKTLPEFFEVFRFDKRVANALWELFGDKDIRNYIMRNAMLDMPLIGRLMFLQDARKVVPSLKLKDLSFARKFGGIRPQLIDKNAQELSMGEAKIDNHDGIIFNMTPSPGATSCLESALRDMRSLTEHLKTLTVDEMSLQVELLNGS